MAGALPFPLDPGRENVGWGVGEMLCGGVYTGDTGRDAEARIRVEESSSSSLLGINECLRFFNK
jgi:hypothetical protein